MPKGDGPFRRMKILVEPLDGVDYGTRLAARIAWNSNVMFKRIIADSTDGRHINRTIAEKHESRISEVTIKFDKGRQGINVRIPPPPKEVVAQMMASHADQPS